MNDNLSSTNFIPSRLDRITEMMDRYVADGRSAGMLTLVARKGEIVHLAVNGYQDIESKTVLREDTIFRIYSMTKPITSVALMTLMEQGHFHLHDAVKRWMPAFSQLKVYGENGKLEPLNTDITIRHLLTHTAGFSYGFEPEAHPVEKMYAESWRALRKEKTLSEMMELMFEIPLIAQPGTLFNYSIATDICGYLIEIMSDMPFGDYLQQTIFNPLGMLDTSFDIAPEKMNRFATLYGYTDENPLAVLEKPAGSPYEAPVKLQSGGGGLLSTAHDYYRFAQMMLNGGELDGTRIIGRKTVEWVTMNHLPRHLLPLSYNGIVPELATGYGFGLGYCVTLEPENAGTLGSKGDFGWGGMADTYCWVDPQEELIGLLMQQYSPSLTHAGRRDFRNAVYQALI